jgi:hypothetical protein
VRPYGTAEQLTKREPQRGSGIGPVLVQKDLVDLTIAQGSGLDGFDGLRVFGDGTAYAFFGKPEVGATNEKRTFRLSQGELAGLVSAINRDRIARIAGLYTTGTADGTQGFIELKTTKGRVYTWLDNYFEPVLTPSATATTCYGRLLSHHVQRSAAAASIAKKSAIAFFVARHPLSIKMRWVYRGGIFRCWFSCSNPRTLST